MPIQCPYCDREFQGDKINSRHLSVCNPSLKTSTEPCLCGHKSTSTTQMKRHRQTCEAWQARDSKSLRRERQKQTSLKRYGVEDASHLPDVQARREQTNMERFGAVNPFSKGSSVFEKVQMSLVDKRPVLRGDANPFAWPEVQEKIKSTLMDKYGVSSPQQVPEIKARTAATSKERYGGALMGSPVLRSRVEATNEAVYGDKRPSRTQSVKDAIQTTNMERYGVPWTSAHPETRAKQMVTHVRRYGKHWFATSEAKSLIRDVLLSKYGVPYPSMLPVKSGLNTPEALTLSLALPGSIIYTGNRVFWLWLPKLGHFKNPDFIVPGPDPEHPRRGITQVVEVFGDYWHGRIKTGKANWEHEQELIQAYADIGIECLIIWESEVKKNLEDVGTRLRAFLSQ